MKTNDVAYVRETMELMGILLSDRKHRWTKDQKARVNRAGAILRREERAAEKLGSHIRHKR